ncbi:hypothetical protein IKF73_02710 [Candidatus Saccharibacteria bacterium]|nr:hypothetical protein [Candidatus Saccharibacteria bacterium]
MSKTEVRETSKPNFCLGFTAPNNYTVQFFGQKGRMLPLTGEGAEWFVSKPTGQSLVPAPFVGVKSIIENLIKKDEAAGKDPKCVVMGPQPALELCSSLGSPDSAITLSQIEKATGSENCVIIAGVTIGGHNIDIHIVPYSQLEYPDDIDTADADGEPIYTADANGERI